MQILIVRHAIAEDRVAFTATGQSDSLRPLTPKGMERMRQGTRGLKQILSGIDLLATSPLTRAVQTADILHEFYPQAERLELQTLAPTGNPERIIDHLRTLPANVTVALVGHEPDLSALIAWLTAAEPASFLHLKKGAACLLETLGAPAPGNAELLWMIAPRQLRQLGRQ